MSRHSSRESRRSSRDSNKAVTVITNSAAFARRMNNRNKRADNNQRVLTPRSVSRVRGLRETGRKGRRPSPRHQDGRQRHSTFLRLPRAHPVRFNYFVRFVKGKLRTNRRRGCNRASMFPTSRRRRHPGDSFQINRPVKAVSTRINRGLVSNTLLL